MLIPNIYRIQEEEPDDNWVAENIVVKVITKSLGEKYYKKKGVILKVIDHYGAEIRMLESGDKLKLDQVYINNFLTFLFFII